MARMFPDNLEGGNPTPGEKRVFAALRHALVPDSEHWAWYEPVVPGRKGARTPDFIVLGPDYGVVVLEVKDWSASSIVRITRNAMTIREADGSEQPHTHPEKQAAEASYRVRERFRNTPGLTHESGKHAGHPVLPVNFGVAYLNMTRSELNRLEENGAPIRASKCLAREDLERTDAEGARRLLAAFQRLGDVHFSFDLDNRVRERVRVAVQPQLAFFDPREMEAAVRSSRDAAKKPAAGPRQDAETSAAAPRVTRAPLPKLWRHFLDDKQARMARQLASPRTLVYGPAGSGKTVFLVARAQYWLDRRPESRVLYTCYNASLASYLRHVFSLKGLAPDGEHLTVRHYHDLCGTLLGRNDIHERSAEFYRTLEPRMLRELSRRDDLPEFDCILVDEGQDFTRRMIEVLVRLTASGGEITVVCDPAQDIYGRWSPDNLAPMRQVETEHLVDCYRNTAPIFGLALAVLPEATRETMGLNRLELTRPEDVGRKGPSPELVPLPGLDDLVTLIAETVEAFDREGRPLSDLAVLYGDRNSIPNFAGRLRHAHWQASRDPRFQQAEEEDTPLSDPTEGTMHADSTMETASAPDRPHFAEALEQELRARGIPAEWVARNFAAKASFDISQARLTLSTVHSAKGMDFHTVILLGTDTLDTREGTGRDRSAALLFTGITRAREQLVLPYFLDRAWVPLLRERLREIGQELGT